MDDIGKIFHVNFLVYAHWFMSIIISQMKDYSISVYQDRYVTSVMAKYLDTVTVKTRIKFYKTNFLSDMIFTKAYASTSDEKIAKLTMEFNIHYIACIVSFIYFLYTRVALSFEVHKLERFSANPGKINLKRLVYLLIYIRYNKTLVLNYYADMKNAHLSSLFRKASIDNKNHYMAFSDHIWQDCPETGRITQEYIFIIIKVDQLTISHILQYQLINQGQKV